MDSNLEKLESIRTKIAKIDSPERPPILFLYKEGHNKKSFSLTDEKILKNKETFYICSPETYDEIDNINVEDSYYLCNTYEEVELAATFIVENYKRIYE